MIRRVGTDREWQAVAIHDRHDFHAFSAPRRPNFLATALRRCERGVDEAFRLIDLAFLAQGIGKIREYLAQHFLATPLLEAPIDRKSTRLNSSHSQISYAVFCLKKKKN